MPALTEFTKARQCLGPAGSSMWDWIKKALKAHHKMLSGLLAETIAFSINKYSAAGPLDGT